MNLNEYARYLTDVMAIHIEYVGVGERGLTPNVARITMVNRNGFCFYDTFVKPGLEVVGYWTKYGVIWPECFQGAKEYFIARGDVIRIICGRTVVGHNLEIGLKILGIEHPPEKMEDTNRIGSIRSACCGGELFRRRLETRIMKEIQKRQNCPVEWARIAMSLYLKDLVHRAKFDDVVP